MTIEKPRKHFIGSIIKPDIDETEEERFNRRLIELSRAKHGLISESSLPVTEAKETSEAAHESDPVLLGTGDVDSASDVEMIRPAGLPPVGGVLVTRSSAPLSPAKELALFMTKLRGLSEEEDQQTVGDTEAEPEAEATEAPVSEAEDEAEESVDELGLAKYAEPSESVAQPEEKDEGETDNGLSPSAEEELPAPLYKPQRPPYQNDLQFARELSLAEPKLVAKSSRDWMNPKK